MWRSIGPLAELRITSGGLKSNNRVAQAAARPRNVQERIETKSRRFGHIIYLIMIEAIIPSRLALSSGLEIDCQLRLLL
ncbi:MAG: hypothetical protein MHMPM18_000970 [Marteilia pararefringens]